MSERLSAAIDELEEHLAQQLQEVADTKKMINALCKRIGSEPKYADVNVEVSGSLRPDQFYGKPLASAAGEFLDRRRRACTTDEILVALVEGGFDFDAAGWKERDRLRLLASSLAKNNQKFHRLPNGTFGLLAWYDQAVIKKAEREERKQNGTTPEAEAHAAVAGADDKGEKVPA